MSCIEWCANVLDVSGAGRARCAVVTVAALLITIGAAPAEAGGIGSGFVENTGQLDPAVCYYASGENAAVYLVAGGLVLDLAGPSPMEHQSTSRRRAAQDLQEASEGLLRARCAVRVHFTGGQEGVLPEGRDELRAKYNYFLGADPAGWRTDVASYGEAVYEDVWPGVDLRCRVESGRLDYELLASSAIDLDALRFSYEGALATENLPDGTVLVRTSVGDLVDVRPGPDRSRGSLIWARDAGGDTRDGCDLDASTFLGGTGPDEAWAIVPDGNGNSVTVGETAASDFPATTGAYQEILQTANDAFVAKFEGDLSDLVWCTYLGGDSGDCGRGLDLDFYGNVVVVGSTFSSDFPTTSGAADESYNGSGDAFVAKLSSDGASLNWGTYVGGTSIDGAYDVALDHSGKKKIEEVNPVPPPPGRGGGARAGSDPYGRPVVVGRTNSSNFPTTSGAYNQTHNGEYDYDAFVLKLHKYGTSLVWSTYLGGDSDDANINPSIVLDTSQRPVVAGTTTSLDFPTTSGAYDESYNGSGDVFLTKLHFNGSNLSWSTFVGGDGNEHNFGLERDPNSCYLLAGRTTSLDFPTTSGAYDVSHNGGYDAYAARMNSTASSLLWGTYLGGSEDDYCFDLSLDSDGEFVLVGETESSDFPRTEGAYDVSFNGGGSDAFASRLNGTATALVWSTFLGGGDWDAANGVCHLTADHATLTGVTWSSDFPTTQGAYDRSFGSYSDAFVSVIGPTRGSPRSAVADDPASASPRWALHGNAPNPFSPGTSIQYELSEPAIVDLRIYAASGRLVRVLADQEVRGPGVHVVPWDGRDERGLGVASGVYFCRMEADGVVAQKPLVLLK